jgi:hypothetical protein
MVMRFNDLAKLKTLGFALFIAKFIGNLRFFENQSEFCARLARFTTQAKIYACYVSILKRNTFSTATVQSRPVLVQFPALPPYSAFASMPARPPSFQSNRDLTQYIHSAPDNSPAFNNSANSAGTPSPCGLPVSSLRRNSRTPGTTNGRATRCHSAKACSVATK